MAKIFITGSADGLGQLAAKALIGQGHSVLLHARNAERAHQALQSNPGAVGVIIGDLKDINETKNMAGEVNNIGKFDAVIHNAGVYNAHPRDILAVNVLAPYLLTCLIHKPGRLIYLSSGMHLQGHARLDYLKFDHNLISYSDSKLYVLMLCLAIADKWRDVYANAVDPGWVPTKMGGHGAPDDLQKGYETQAWLAASKDEEAQLSGHYYFHQKIRPHNTEADDKFLREQLISFCEDVTGVSLPE